MPPDPVHQFDLDDHLALFREGADSVQILDPLAAYVWDSTTAGMSAEAIAGDLTRQFDIPLEQTMRDVQRLVAQWTESFLTEPRPREQRSHSEPPEDLYSQRQPATETRLSFPRFSVRLRYDSREIAELMASVLGYLTSSSGGTDHVVDIVADDTGYLILTDQLVTASAINPADAVVLAFREIVELACQREDWLTILHAGGVAWREQGIIFPSFGGAGKSTLTAALACHGFDYINDDVIPIERARGKLIPIPVSLCIKAGSWPLLQGFYPELDQLKTFGRNNLRVKYLPPPSLASNSDGYTTKYLIIPNYQHGAQPVLEKVSPVEGLRAIIEGESLLPHPLEPGDVEALVAWVGRLECYRFSYDGLKPAVAAIKAFLSGNQTIGYD